MKVSSECEVLYIPNMLECDDFVLPYSPPRRMDLKSESPPNLLDRVATPSPPAAKKEAFSAHWADSAQVNQASPSPSFSFSVSPLLEKQMEEEEERKVEKEKEKAMLGLDSLNYKDYYAAVGEEHFSFSASPSDSFASAAPALLCPDFRHDTNASFPPTEAVDEDADGARASHDLLADAMASSGVTVRPLDCRNVPVCPPVSGRVCRPPPRPPFPL